MFFNFYYIINMIISYLYVKYKSNLNNIIQNINYLQSNIN